ncbi:hypothetical protein GHV37_05270 [Citrobacter koseri]|uniref:hypothetical protein n=1 Tax=Citrobacter koseri TaxID=545 RepID=UPI001903B7BC|nr:hypothetical protein [Citrobacter koseri]MBJ9234056.1 hypothetical protein [Citrobacter koseri]
MTTIKDRIFAAMHGMSAEQYALEKARDNLKSVTDNFLGKHPEYLRGRFAEGKPANGLELLKSASADTPTKTKRITKSLGADSRPVVSHTTDHIDPEMLAKAKAAAAALAKSDPDRYGNIIKQQGV